MRPGRALEVARDLQLLHGGRGQPVYFHGETMLPFFQEGDELRIEPAVWESLRPGDIVTYRDEERYPTRRIARILHHRSELLIKGDALPPEVHFRVSRDRVLGRATARLRHGTWVEDSSWEWRLAAYRARARDISWRARSRILRTVAGLFRLSGFR